MPEQNSRFAWGLVDALARLGVEHASLTPGSRSTPLALALAGDDRITDWAHHDERSSAFFALGIAHTTRRPAVVLTTSGTAAAELYPAMVEAHYGRVPLIAITADRPAELRGTGAPQTIDQRDLFGRMPLWSHDVDAGGVDPQPWIGSLAARMVSSSLGPPAGPVHLNVGFREPLVPDGEASPLVVRVPQVTFPRTTVDTAELAGPGASISGKRGVVVAGPQDSSVAVAAAVRFAAATGWPILADPLSGLRAGAHDLSSVVAHADALAWEGWLETASPEAVIRFGALPTSKPLWQWLAEHPDVPQVLLEPHGWRDPVATATAVIRAEPAPVLDSLAHIVEPADGAWRDAWHRADLTAAEAIDRALESTPFPSEPAVARLLGRALPDPSVLWVASSMPVRDVDSFFGTSAKGIRFAANRGVNGIDGFLSTGLGSCAVSGLPTVLLAGDLSALHDLTALATAARLGIPATIVVINNDGGGIFHFLPQVGHPDFERLFAAPHGLGLSGVAQALGVPGEELTDPDDLVKALGDAPAAPRLLEVRTDRAENVAVHRTIRRAVRAALEAI